MKHRALIVGYILLIWFVISFVTNLMGPLMPVIIQDFHLSLGMAGFLPFSFF
ncbi:MFS transporter, partial [Escherichia coli]|nr:MFS transporter [Escherichia coli]